MTTPRRLAFALALALALAWSGCSSGSSGSAPDPGTAFDAHLVHDTRGGTDGRLHGRLASIVLEDDQGGLTANLVLGGNPEFVISDPLGTSFGLELADFGPGRFTALHLGFVPGTLVFDAGNGAAEPVTLSGGSITAPFLVPLDVAATGAHRVQLRHRSPVELVRDPRNTLTFTPDMVAESGVPVLLQEARIEVVSVDVAGGTAEGLIRSMSGLRTTLSFLSNAVLVIDDTERTVAGFLGALRAKDELEVFGLLDALSNTRVAYAERIDPLDTTPGRGRKNKVRGAVTKASATAIDVRLFEIRIGGRDIPKQQPVTLDVDSRTAKIKYVPRYGRHRGHLEPKDLATGMYVEVEWHGDAPNLAVSAHKINIRSDGRFDFLDRILGTVRSVDTTARTITLSGSFDFGREVYREVTVALAADTLLVEDENGAATEMPLADVRADDECWLLGVKRPGANLDGILIVVVR